MTEDDTFNTLRRIPWNQMYDLWMQSDITPGRSDNDPKVNKFFKSYGWTYEAYLNHGHWRNKK